MKGRWKKAREQKAHDAKLIVPILSDSAAFEAVSADAHKRGITEGPYGWIQWKGTEVCMDIHCECGVHGHVDADFVYYLVCKNCRRRYAVSSYVALVPIDYMPTGCFQVFDDGESDD